MNNAAPFPPQPHALKLSTDFISPINTLLVVSLTIVDLATPAIDRHAARIFSIVLAVGLLAILWALSRAYQKRPADTGTGWVVRQLVSSKAAWISAVLIVAGVGVMFWKDAHAATPNPGAAASAVPSLQNLQAAVLGIREDTTAIRGDTTAIRSDTSSMRGDLQSIREVVAPADARGRLRTLGYGLDDESKARAIETCDLPALQLYVAAGEKFPIAVPVFGVRGGSVLEKPLISGDPRLPEVLELLAAQGMKFDQPYMLTFTQANTAQIPKLDQLNKKVASRSPLGISPSIVSANALTLSIWFDNRPAAAKLLSLGANPAVGVTELLPKTDSRGNIVGGLAPVPIASAESEAKRLGRADWIH